MTDLAAPNPSPAPNAPAAPAAPLPNGNAAPNEMPWFADTQKDYVTNKGWAKAADAVTSYQALETLVGADKAGRTIVRPKDEKDADGIAKFREALGVPKDLTGYKVPDTLKDDPTIKEFANQALALGIPATQFEKIVEWTQGMAKKSQDDLNNEVLRVTTAELDKLKALWGPEFNAKAEFAKRFAAESGWQPSEWEAIERAVGTRRLLEQFHKHGASMGESKFAGGGAEGGGMTPAKQAIEKLVNELRAERTANRVSAPDYFARMERLQAQLAATA